MLKKHNSYLRWQCPYCHYITHASRKYDHKQHWRSKHMGEPQEPRAHLVDREVEDKRMAEEKRRRARRLLMPTIVVR